jgi:GTP-binding protein
MKVHATFVRSAVVAEDFPRDGTPAIALVGRSNVGKSSVVNALVRQRVARTSAAPGKTRLANIYRIERDGARSLYVVDLPGYGFARGGSAGFEEVATAFFDHADAARGLSRATAALLLVDARHTGLDSDRQAWDWLAGVTDRRAVVATKIDKLARGERIRAQHELESVFENPVVPTSATTGEGLENLWKLIDSLVNNNPRGRSRPDSSSRPSSRPPDRSQRKATAPRRKNSSE